ncbi:MAG: MnhB domain-containing protein, partial [Lysobacteraceae bacterium]
ALVLVGAFYLQTLAHGAAAADRQLRHDWTAWIGAGLLAATVTGLGALFFAHPFLTSSTPYVVVPGLEWVGEIPFASAMGFDTGVLVTVAGALMLVLVLLSRLSRPEHDR